MPSSVVPSPSPNPRKRTTSFVDPLPRKTSRTMLRRTESFLSLTDFHDEPPCDDGGSFLHMTSTPPPPSPRPTRARFYCGEQRETMKPRRRTEFTIGPASGASTPKRASARVAAYKAQSKPTASHVRTTSPLSPTRKLLPPRATFPRSKPEPDLYRVALKGRMRSSPEGEQILRMGPRLAIAILSATRELEQIVSAHEDDDVTMGDETESIAVSVWGLGRDMMAVSCGA